jgi:pantoate--beta-alanine ligase
MLTIVLKLFNIIHPTRAYFGEKDFQQLKLIEGMVRALFLPVQIVAVPTVREKDGLAMSSRNVRLNHEERALAPKIYEQLIQPLSAEEIAENLAAAGFKVDYIKDVDKRRYAAVKLGEVRLIDNVKI